jgi:hypothetical protein
MNQLATQVINLLHTWKLPSHSMGQIKAVIVFIYYIFLNLFGGEMFFAIIREEDDVPSVWNNQNGAIVHSKLCWSSSFHCCWGVLRLGRAIV